MASFSDYNRVFHQSSATMQGHVEPDRFSDLLRPQRALEEYEYDMLDHLDYEEE